MDKAQDDDNNMRTDIDKHDDIICVALMQGGAKICVGLHLCKISTTKCTPPPPHSRGILQVWCKPVRKSWPSLDDDGQALKTDITDNLTNMPSMRGLPRSLQ